MSDKEKNINNENQIKIKMGNLTDIRQSKIFDANLPVKTSLYFARLIKLLILN